MVLISRQGPARCLAGFYRTARRNASFVANPDSYRTLADHCRTAFADFRELPPKISFVEECSLAADRSRGGRWLTVSMTSDEPFVYRVRTSDSPTGKRAILAAPKQKNGRIQWAGFLGERIVAVMEIAGKDALAARAAYALIEQNGRLVRIKELRERTNARHNHGIIRLNDGDELFVWDGDAYEWRDGRLELAMPLGAKSYGSELLRSAPFGADGFFYLSESRLFSARRGQTPAAHLPRCDNVMSVCPGPMGSLLLKEGNNKLGDLGKLYFPEEEVYIRIEPEWFPDEDRDDIRALFWIADSQRVVAATSERFWAVPPEIALSHPRYRASSGRKAGN